MHRPHHPHHRLVGLAAPARSEPPSREVPSASVTQQPLLALLLGVTSNTTRQCRLRVTAPRAPAALSNSVGIDGELPWRVGLLLHEHPVVVRVGSGWDGHPQGTIVGDQEHSSRVEGVQVFSGLFWWDAQSLSEVGRKACPDHELIELTRGHNRNAQPVGPAVLQHESHAESSIGVRPEIVVDLLHHLFVRAFRGVPLAVVDTGRFEVVEVLRKYWPYGAWADALGCCGSACGFAGAAGGRVLLGCHDPHNDRVSSRFSFILVCCADGGAFL